MDKEKETKSEETTETKEVKETKEEKKVLEKKKKEAEEKKKKEAEEKRLAEEKRITEEIKSMTGLQRFAKLKEEVRYIVLEKEESGYASQYFYAALQDMQKVFVRLENELFLTSRYTEETRILNPGQQGISASDPVIRVFAVRVCIDLLTNEEVQRTEIDITNLKELKDVYGIGKYILKIAEPKDAIRTLLLDYHEPQSLGSISTYFQRYTYNQLYDFQETREDAIEKRGRLLSDYKEIVLDESEDEETEDATKEEPKKKKVKKESKPKEEKKDSPKDKRLEDQQALKLRNKIKKEFERQDIIDQLNGRKLSTMTKEETAEFYQEMLENKTKIKTESEGE